MRCNEPPGRRCRIHLLERASQILVGQDVKPVAAHPLLEESARDGESSRRRGLGSTECGVEAGDVGDARAGRHRREDCGKVVRLMERSQGYELARRVEHLLRYEFRSGELDAAMDDTMADADRRAGTGKSFDPAQDLAQKRFVVE